MKKWIWIGAGLVLVLVIGGGAFFWYQMQQPLYTPGMVRAGKNLRAPLAPPCQSGGQDYWTVEKDIQLYHFSDGNGRNVLVVHGGPGYPFNAPLPGFKLLDQTYRFNYYDQRGCGRSTRPIDRFSPQNYSANVKTLDQTLGLGAQIADIERIRQILGEDRLILIGHSFGGFLASLYAAEFPEHVAALVLVAPADVLVMPPPDGGLYEQVRLLLPQELQAEYSAYLKDYFNYGQIFSKSEADLAAMNAAFIPYYAAALAYQGLNIPAEDNPTAVGGWMVQGIYFSIGQKHDYRPALKGVTAPVLVIHGDRDLQSETASQAYASAFPNAQFQVIPNAGHFSFSDQPQAFARVVGEFLDQVK